MEAPKKIYVSIGPRQSLVAKAGITLKSDKEYVNKDALLEWLNGKMTVEEATEGIVGGYDLALKDVIKHIESL